MVIPAAAVAEATRAGLEVAVAATVLDVESDGGRNIFGAPKDCGPARDTPVTRARYEAYKAARAVCGTQGVGPCQLTWPAYQDQADELGGCWVPEVNCRVGFWVLAQHIREHGLEGGFAKYNTGSPRPNAYSQRAMTRLARWRQVVDG